MEQSNFLLGSILLLFVMLWLPLGQQDFLLDHWMKVGTYAIPFLLIGAFSLIQEEIREQIWANGRFVGILMLIAYIVHQFEEHWIDVYGNYYAFYDFNNNFVLSALGEPDSDIRPLTKEAIFVINTSLVWLVGALAIWSSPKRVFPLIAMASIIVVNGVVHILASFANWAYNPGVVTSIIIFVPCYIVFARSLLRSSKSYRKLLLAGLLWAVVAHVVMVLGMLLANWFHVFPEYVYFILLVIISVLPLAFYRDRGIA